MLKSKESERCLRNNKSTKIAFNVEPHIIDKCDMDIMLEAGENKEEMIPFFSIASREFDKDLVILKKILHQFEQRTHSENAYKFSERATLAAGWWFYDVFFKRDFIQRVFQLLYLIAFRIRTKRPPQ
jgi:hypothetical protein